MPSSCPRQRAQLATDAMRDATRRQRSRRRLHGSVDAACGCGFVCCRRSSCSSRRASRAQRSRCARTCCRLSSHYGLPCMRAHRPSPPSRSQPPCLPPCHPLRPIPPIPPLPIPSHPILSRAVPSRPPRSPPAHALAHADMGCSGSTRSSSPRLLRRTSSRKSRSSSARTSSSAASTSRPVPT